MVEMVEEHQPSTSASTIRGLHHLDMAMLPQPPHSQEREHVDTYLHNPPSPHSAFGQSEPGSPSGDSVSSFPSVSSSFLFSSVPASPPHPHPHSEAESELGDSTSGLVIPSLTLPSPSRRPTPYGQTLGELRLLLLGPKGTDTNAIASQLVDDNEDVVEVGIWEEDPRAGGSSARGKRKATLRASTHWVEHRDAHGLERVEPARNVELVELPPYDPYGEVETVVERVLPVIHSPFYQVLDILDREQPPNGPVAQLLSSSSTPLYSALVLLATPALSSAEKTLIEALSSHIPIIILPSTSSPLSRLPNISYKVSSPHLSAFRPASLDALRTGLFRTPSTLAALRAEAAARFLRWREVERAVERVHWGVSSSSTLQSSSGPKADRDSSEDKAGWWDKGAWEAQWEGSLSQEVALHLRRRRAGTIRRIAPLTSLPTLGRGARQATSYFSQRDTDITPDTAGAGLDTPMPHDADQGGLLSPRCPSGTAFDPLHLPSLFIFSVSLLDAFRARVTRSLGFRESASGSASSPAVREEAKRRSGRMGFGFAFGVGLALVGAFCAGVGFGLFAARI
ncbi:hypothetical protein C8Q73DRAFT_832085 [Cubamyces lactineus]|nr:hypothetical protein C8Q73DRAFT_832085 [Cubamyces lactineus]